MSFMIIQLSNYLVQSNLISLHWYSTVKGLITQLAVLYVFRWCLFLTNFGVIMLTYSPSMNCLCCWIISSHRCLCCSKRCTTKFFCRITLSLSRAWDCISAFSISSSWTLQRSPRTSRCSSELTRRGSSSSKRRAWSRSSRNLRSSNAFKQKV